jgi:hypothetical protein
MEKYKKLLWISRIVMVAAALGIMLTSYFFYEPRNFPLGMRVSAQLGQLVAYGGPVALVTAFAWFWPEAGGIVTILVGLFSIWRFGAPWMVVGVRITGTPMPVYYLLYVLFIGGGILSLIAGLNRKRVPYTPTRFMEKFQQAARIMALATIGVFMAAYIFIYPPLIFFAVPAVLIVTIAWRWPTPGGILMLAISAPGFYPLIQVGWEISWKWPIYVLLVVFISSAVMHLIVAWQIRKLRTTARHPQADN